jgi:nucleolar protein 4
VAGHTFTFRYFVICVHVRAVFPYDSEAGPVRHIKVAKGGKATVHFVLATDAARCVAEMQGLEIAGTPLKLSLEQSKEAVRATVADAAAAKGDSKSNKNYTKLNTRLFRLVIRNLPFGIKEAAVRSAFETFGTLEEVHLPLKAGRDGKEQTRGFGFLQYSSRTEAKKAIDEGNGMELLGRPVAVDWAVAKEIYQEMVPSKSKDAGKGKSNKGDEDEAVGESNKRKAPEEPDKADKPAPIQDTATKRSKADKADKAGGAPVEIDREPEVRLVLVCVCVCDAEEEAKLSAARASPAPHPSCPKPSPASHPRP